MANGKSSAVVKIVPQVDAKKFNQAMQSPLNKLSKGVLSVGKTMAKAGAVGAGAFGIMNLVLGKNNEYLTSMDELLNDIVGKADSLSTISADLGAMSKSSGSFALTSAVMQSQGIQQDSRDKLISGIQDSIATGGLKVKKGADLDYILQDLQNQWKEARRVGDDAKAKGIEDILGLRGKQASEFLQGNLAQDKKDMSQLIGLTEEQLTASIEANATLEGIQAKSLAGEELKLQAEVSKVANSGTIKSQAELEAFKKREFLSMMGSYDVMAEAEKSKMKFQKFINDMINNIMGGFKANMSIEDRKDYFIKVLISGLTKVIRALKEVFIEVGKSVWAGIVGKRSIGVSPAEKVKLANNAELINSKVGRLGGGL